MYHKSRTLLFPLWALRVRSHLTILRYSRADAGLSWGLPDSLMLGWNIAVSLMFVCLFCPCSDEVRRNSAQAHHDLSELRPGSLQTHEVSHLYAISASFFFFNVSKRSSRQLHRCPLCSYLLPWRRKKNYLLPISLLSPLCQFFFLPQVTSLFAFFHLLILLTTSITFSHSPPCPVSNYFWFLRNLNTPVEGRHHSASSEPCAEDAAHLGCDVTSLDGHKLRFFFPTIRLPVPCLVMALNPCSHYTATKAWLADWVEQGFLNRMCIFTQ